MNLLLYYLTIAATPPVLTLQPVWEYHRKELHASIETGNYYSAKRALAYLKKTDPSTYAHKNYDLTNAWIATREENWDTAYQLNRDTGMGEADSILEAAQSLEKMGRPEQALTELFSQGNKHQGRTRWQAYALAARCNLALNQTKQAIVYYRKLIQRRAPILYRTDANCRLVELYYKSGDTKRARKLAQTVQTRHPASDAALFTLYLQEAFETAKYMSHPTNLNRLAMVCYRNRDFQRSNRFFKALVETTKNRNQQAKARYHLALTYSKQGDRESAQAAFQEQAPFLEGTAYEGRSHFQQMRAHYLNGRDRETIEQVETYWQTTNDKKWRRECARLWILALRRQQDQLGFESLSAHLKQDHAPAWLWQYYHRNGMLWAMQEGRLDQARLHLEAYQQVGGSRKLAARLETSLWKGIIDWALGAQQAAVDSWLWAADKDPNHYFGLVARRMLEVAAKDTLIWEHMLAQEPNLKKRKLKELRALYYLAPNRLKREQLADALTTKFLEERPEFAIERQLTDREAMELAEIGRFDWAARVLPKRKQRLAYHLQKAHWYHLAQDIKASIKHAEILVNSYPRWLPYEMMPSSIQQLYFPLGHERLVRERAAERQVDPLLLQAIIREESRFDHNAKSWASARGLMQFIPATAREMADKLEGMGGFTLPMLYQPEVAIRLGATYVDHLMETFEDVPIHAIAAYNAGESSVHRWRNFSQESATLAFVWDVTYSETKRYCQKVMRAYHHYSRLYGNPKQVIEAPELHML